MRKYTFFLALGLAACGSSSSDHLDGGGCVVSGPDGTVESMDSGTETDADVEDGAVESNDAGVGEGGGDESDAGDDADAGEAGGDTDAGHDSSVADVDGGDEGDAATDAQLETTDSGTDAETETCPTILLAGGAEVTAQGWTTTMQAPSTLSYGADYVRLETSTMTGALTSGQLLLSYPQAVESGVPFKVEIVMQVESVQAHNLLDSAAAILGSFTAPHGVAGERSEMLYLDSARMGWADDTQSADVAVVDGQYHTYVLSVDAQNVARVTRDGVELLTRDDFTTNGTIAIGDQTNDANVDGVIRIRSVRKLCP